VFNGATKDCGLRSEVQRYWAVRAAAETSPATKRRHERGLHASAGERIATTATSLASLVPVRVFGSRIV
jgi:hypothetical protein